MVWQCYIYNGTDSYMLLKIRTTPICPVFVFFIFVTSCTSIYLVWVVFVDRFTACIFVCIRHRRPTPTYTDHGLFLNIVICDVQYTHRHISNSFGKISWTIERHSNNLLDDSVRLIMIDVFWKY